MIVFTKHSLLVLLLLLSFFTITIITMISTITTTTIIIISNIIAIIYIDLFAVVLVAGAYANLSKSSMYAVVYIRVEAAGACGVGALGRWDTCRPGYGGDPGQWMHCIDDGDGKLLGRRGVRELAQGEAAG